MRQQHEITTSAPLLGKDGDLLEPGWARSLLPVYRRADIKASPMRIKEWDYYLITDGHIGLALTIADNSYMGLDSISFLHFDEGWEQTTSRMRALPLGKTHLPESSAEGARSPGAAMPWRFIMRTARASSRSTWTSSAARTPSRVLSS